MKKTMPLLLVALLATGCASEVPIPKTFPLSTQQKLKSGHHWDVIARDTAQQAAASLARQSLNAVPVAVTTTQPDAPFQQGFRGFLITHLVGQNQAVTQKQADVEVQFEAQIVRHPSERTATIPGELTTLVAGIMVVRNAALTWGNGAQAAGALGLAGLVDWGKGHATNLSNTEVIVTTSITRDGRYLMRKSDVYYIDDEDGSLFQQMKQWKVVG